MSAGLAHRGELALVLHTHMPYVEGFGTWPFGEEWLWEAMATCYLPLLDVLERDVPITLSLTPVLCDQLEAGGVPERFCAFLRDVRAATHERDIAGCRDSGAHELVGELERSAADYQRADERFAAVEGDLLGALARHATWTSSATHAVLPLLATTAGIDLQVRTGAAAARLRLPRLGGRLLAARVRVRTRAGRRAGGRRRPRGVCGPHRSARPRLRRGAAPADGSLGAGAGADRPRDHGAGVE